jgi:hypothetical protein
MPNAQKEVNNALQFGKSTGVSNLEENTLHLMPGPFTGSDASLQQQDQTICKYLRGLKRR